MTLRRMDIRSLIVGGGPLSSLLVLSTHPDRLNRKTLQLPIKIGPTEARSISAGIEHKNPPRPLTHDLMISVISSLGARPVCVKIVGVEKTTFFAQLELVKEDGSHVFVDARPSDAVALAVRSHIPVYADETVLSSAAMPDFATAEQEAGTKNLEAFHSFVEQLSPEDFS